jgi:hypothetical protein
LSFEVNIFKNVGDTDCSNVVKVASVLNAIKKGKWKSPVEAVRSLKASNASKEVVTKAKAFLPAVIWTGVFEERLDDACVLYNQLMVIDVDNISAKRLVKFREELKNNPWVYSFFSGPTKGVKILVFVDSDISWHNKHAFWSLENEFLDLYNIKIDPSGKNLSRLCFVSYDPDLYINPNPVYFSPKETVDPLEEFRAIGRTYESKNNIQVTDSRKIIDVCVKMVTKSKTGSYHKGNRNNFIFALSCLLCEYGLQPDQALNLVSMRYQSLKIREVRPTVDSAYKKAKHNFGTKVLNEKGNPNQKSLL